MNWYMRYEEKAMAPHPSALAWKIPWMKEPGGLQSMGSLRVGHDWATFTFHFHALEKEMATHSNVLAWRIPGTGEPGGLPSMRSPRVRHNWSDSVAYALWRLPWWLTGKCRRHRFDPWVRKIPWGRKQKPTPVFLPGKFHGQRSLVGYIVHEVTKESDTT